jgi:hypothetical protein
MKALSKVTEYLIIGLVTILIIGIIYSLFFDF